jgi:hypothetical protein
MSLQATSLLTAAHDYGTYKNISASSLVETGSGTLQGLIINSHTNGTIKFWDNTSAATTVLCNTITLAATERWIPLFGAKFVKGLYATIGGVADVTIIYN